MLREDAQGLPRRSEGTRRKKAGARQEDLLFINTVVRRFLGDMNIVGMAFL